MNLSKTQGLASGRFWSVLSLSVSLETNDTFFQDAWAILLLITFADILFYHWNSESEHCHIFLDSVSMWKRYLHIRGAESFLTYEWLETSCGVIPSLLERVDTAEEGCSCDHLLQKQWGFLWEDGPHNRYNLPTKMLIPVHLSSFRGDLGTKYHYTRQVQVKFLYARLPCFSTRKPHRRGHTLGMTKWAEEN